MRRAFVVLNPAAGRGSGRHLAKPIAEAFRANGWEAEIRLTTRPGEERSLAAEGARAGWPTIIAAGGDGTVHGVANGILEADSHAALGVLAIGTGNDFAKLTGLPIRHPRTAVSKLARAQSRTYDVGKVEGEYFTNSLGVGFSTAALVEMNSLPRLRGFTLYLAAVIKTFARFQPIVVRVAASEFDESARVMMAEVAIGTTAGGGFRITPDADPTDGLFDVCVIREVGLAKFLRYVPRVIRGTHGGTAPVTIFRTRQLTLETETSPLVLHLDGELRTYEQRSVRIEVEPGRLEVLCVS